MMQSKVAAGQEWQRPNGSRFVIDHLDEKNVYYWLSAGSSPQYRSIRIELLLRRYQFIGIADSVWARAVSTP
jgi:hypothetical protein